MLYIYYIYIYNFFYCLFSLCVPGHATNKKKKLFKYSYLFLKTEIIMGRGGGVAGLFSFGYFLAGLWGFGALLGQLC